VTRVNDREFVADVEASALLVVGETWHSGWRCEVDGLPQPVVRANHAMKAVALGPGRHRVTFFYRPRSLVLGAFCSAVSLALFVGWLLFRRVRNPSSTARSG
jgi:uncharacterized membrane protein YfhO